MHEPIEQREVQWAAFLSRWQFDDLRALTLEQYCDLKSDDTLSFWLLQRTAELGDFKEGPLSMGIRRHSNGQAKPDNAYNCYDAQYVWLKMLGDSADQAFSALKQGLIEAAEAGRTGELERLDALTRQPGALMRKMAFLYQDKQVPCLLPIYSKDHLRAALGANAPTKVSALNQLLMTRRGDVPLFDYADHLWERACNQLNLTNEVARVLDLFASDSRLAKALRNADDRQLFYRLALAVHQHGLDWWVVKLAQSGSIRFGRCNKLENSTTSVVAELDPRPSGLLVRFGRRLVQEPAWQPLTEDLVSHVEQEG